MAPHLAWRFHRNMAVILTMVSVAVVFALIFGPGETIAPTVSMAGITAFVSVGIGSALASMLKGMEASELKAKFVVRDPGSLGSFSGRRGAVSTETATAKKSASAAKGTKNTNKTTAVAPEAGVSDGAQREREGAMIWNST